MIISCNVDNCRNGNRKLYDLRYGQLINYVQPLSLINFFSEKTFVYQYIVESTIVIYDPTIYKQSESLS